MGTANQDCLACPGNFLAERPWCFYLFLRRLKCQLDILISFLLLFLSSHQIYKMALSLNFLPLLLPPPQLPLSLEYCLRGNVIFRSVGFSTNLLSRWLEQRETSWLFLPKSAKIFHVSSCCSAYRFTPTCRVFDRPVAVPTAPHLAPKALIGSRILDCLSHTPCGLRSLLQLCRAWEMLPNHPDETWWFTSWLNSM